jgi:hypothetical protein
VQDLDVDIERIHVFETAFDISELACFCRGANITIRFSCSRANAVWCLNGFNDKGTNFAINIPFFDFGVAVIDGNFWPVFFFSRFQVVLCQITLNNMSIGINNRWRCIGQKTSPPNGQHIRLLFLLGELYSYFVPGGS